MANQEELPMANQDDGAGQQVNQSNVDEGALSGGQVSLPEEEGHGGQFENGQDNQDAFSERESPQEMMGMQEPGMQSQDEMGPLPEGQGEPIDPETENVDPETLDRLPADQPEREAVPVRLDGPK